PSPPRRSADLGGVGSGGTRSSPAGGSTRAVTSTGRGVGAARGCTTGPATGRGSGDGADAGAGDGAGDGADGGSAADGAGGTDGTGVCAAGSGAGSAGAGRAAAASARGRAVGSSTARSTACGPGVAAGGAGTRSSGGTRVGPLAFRLRTATTTRIVAPTSTAPRPSMTSADADKGSCMVAHRTPFQLTVRNNDHPERDADADRSERSAPLPEGAEDCRPCSPEPPCPSRRGSSGRDPEAGRDELPVVAAPFAGLSVC